MIGRLYSQAIKEQQGYIISKGMGEFTTGNKAQDVVLEGAKGLYTALTTISRGAWATSVAMGMVWNQPSVDAIDEALKSSSLAPIDAAGKVGFVARAVSEAIPSFLYNMTVGGSGIFVVEYGNAYQDVLNNGGSRLQANAVALPVATINTIIESMQIDRIMKFAGAGKGAKQAVKKMVKDRAYKAFLKAGAKFTGESIKIAINEGVEGALQQGVSIVVPAFITGVYPKDENGNIDWVEVGSQVGQSFVGEGLGGLFLGVGGGIYNARQAQSYKANIAGYIITDEGVPEGPALIAATNIVERLKNGDDNPKEIYREELAKVKMADNRHKASAHIIQKGKGIGDAQYRDIANETTGKNSIKDMNYDEAERFIDALRTAEVEKVELAEGEEAKPEPTATELHAEIQAIKKEPEVIRQPPTEEVTEVVVKPETPKGLKNPLSSLSDRELEKRSEKASPYHKAYIQEIAWRKQQMGRLEGFRGGFLDNTPFGSDKLLQKKVDEVLGLIGKPKAQKAVEKAKPEKKKTLKALKKTSVIEAGKATASGLSVALDRAVGIMSTRVRNISPVIFQEVRNKYINPVKIATAERTKIAHPFLDGINRKLSDADRYDFEVAMWKGEQTDIDRIVSKYNLNTEYSKYREMLDLIYHEANAVGMNMDYRTAYFPSAVKNLDGLLKEIGVREEYAPIVKAMQEAEARKGRELSNDEEIRLIDSMLRGFRVSGITLTKPGFALERTLARNDVSLIKYYYGFEESTSRYIESMTENVQARKFFGKTTKELVKLRANISRLKTNIAKAESGQRKLKDPQTSIRRSAAKLAKLQKELEVQDDKLLSSSIGVYVLDLIENGTIKYDQQVELRQIFEGLFKSTTSSKWLHTMRSLEYAGSLAQVPAIITQYSEVVLSILKAPGTTLPNFVRANLGKSEIKLRDIGVAHIGQEWVDADLNKTVVTLLKPFEAADKVGKETFINSVIGKYRKMAVTNPDAVKKELSKYYPEKAFDSMISSLKSGEVDNNVKGFALNELGDVQPISKFEVPELYAKAGNLRIFYMYKTFVLKRLDIIRNQAYNEIKAGIKTGNRKRVLGGIARLIWLMFMFSLADASADVAKDIIRGKPIEGLDNYIFDNLLQMILLSKYSLNKSKREGPSRFFKDNITFPVSNLDSAFKDMVTLFDEESERGSEVARRVPWIGELYYWYMGEGARKVDEGVYDED